MPSEVMDVLRFVEVLLPWLLVGLVLYALLRLFGWLRVFAAPPPVSPSKSKGTKNANSNPTDKGWVILLLFLLFIAFGARQDKKGNPRPL